MDSGSQRISVLHCRSSAATYGPERALMLDQRDIETRLLALYRHPDPSSPVHPWIEQAREDGLYADQIVDPGPFSIGVVRRLGRRIGTADADILHTHDYKTNILGGLAARKQDRSMPWVATVHLHTSTSRRLRLYRAIDLLLLRLADRVVTVSRDQRRLLLERGVDRRRIALVPNVIDAARFREEADDRDAVRARLGIAANIPLITCIGRLSVQKGMDHFLEAAAQVHETRPDTRFLIAGHGPLRGALEAQAEALGLRDCIRFLGYRADVASILAASDVVALPSRDEGLPVILLEALAMGRPIVATRVGGVPDLIRDGETGLLVPPGAPEEVAARMLELVTDRDEAERMGQAGLAFVKRNCSPDKAARRLSSIYRTVLNERR
jgi:glycosyltransferase involved in cell wall biosynthesis